MVDGLDGLVLVEQEVGEVVVRLGIVRAQAERLLVGRFGLSKATLRPQHRRQVVVCRRVVWRDRNRTFVVALRLVQLPLALQRGAKIELGDRPHQRGREDGPVREHRHGGNRCERPETPRN